MGTLDDEFSDESSNDADEKRRETANTRLEEHDWLQSSQSAPDYRVRCWRHVTGHRHRVVNDYDYLQPTERPTIWSTNHIHAPPNLPSLPHQEPHCNHEKRPVPGYKGEKDENVAIKVTQPESKQGIHDERRRYPDGD